MDKETLNDSVPQPLDLQATAAYWADEAKNREAAARADREAKTVYVAKGPVIGAILIANLITLAAVVAVYLLLK